MLYAFNKGEVCTCPSRALIARVDLRRVHGALPRADPAIRQGDPLDPATMIGAQVSTAQLEKIEGYVKIGREEGAEVLIGGERSVARRRAGRRLLLQADRAEGPQRDARVPGGDLRPGARGDDVPRRGRGARDRQRHAVRPRRRRVDARHARRAFRVGRAIKAGRVWTNCYHHYPAHAAFGGYKASGVGRENHRHDARPLHADEVPAGQLRPEPDGVLLAMSPSARDGDAEALEMIERLRAAHGPLAFFRRPAAARAPPRSACTRTSSARRRTTCASVRSAGRRSTSTRTRTGAGAGRRS